MYLCEKVLLQTLVRLWSLNTDFNLPSFSVWASSQLQPDAADMPPRLQSGSEYQVKCYPVAAYQGDSQISNDHSWVWTKACGPRQVEDEEDSLQSLSPIFV